MRHRLPLVLLLVVLSSPAAAPAAVAPGRVAHPTGLGAPERDVDAVGATAAAALPDGGAVLAGSRTHVSVARLRADGSLDPAFANGPLDLGDRRLHVSQVVRQPDGGLLVAGTGEPASPLEFERLRIVRLTATGALDPTFADGGVASLTIQGSCGGCEPLALQPGGAILATGNTGAASPAITTDPNAPADRRWVVERLTPAGRPDPSFGRDGIQTLPGTPSRTNGGYGVTVAPGGRMIVLGDDGAGPKLTALQPDGSADPAFGGGSPVPVPVQQAYHLLLRPDGTVDVLGNEELARFTPSGAPEPSFGSGGRVAHGLPGGAGRVGMLLAPDGATLVTLAPFAPGQPLAVRRVGDDGSLGTRADVAPAFGGGQGGFGRGLESLLERSGFTATRLLLRPDGSYLAVGGVAVLLPTGEGTGFSSGFFAAAALTGDLRPRTAGFGGAAAPAAALLHVYTQRARTASRHRGIDVRLSTTDAGLALVRIRDSRRRILAQAIVPAYRAGTVRATVRLTRTGERLLRRGGRRRVSAGYEFRDIVAQPAHGTTRGTLR